MLPSRSSSNDRGRSLEVDTRAAQARVEEELTTSPEASRRSGRLSGRQPEYGGLPDSRPRQTALASPLPLGINPIASTRQAGEESSSGQRHDTSPQQGNSPTTAPLDGLESPLRPGRGLPPAGNTSTESSRKAIDRKAIDRKDNGLPIVLQSLESAHITPQIGASAFQSEPPTDHISSVLYPEAMEPLRALAHSDDTTAVRAARESLDSINDRIRSYNIGNDREEDSNVILWSEMVSFFQKAKELESSIAMSSASSDHAAVAGMRGQVQRLAQAYDAFLSAHRYPSSWATHVSPMPSPSSSQAQTQAPSDASMSDVLSDSPARAGLQPGSRPGFRRSANRHGADHVVEDGVQKSIKAWKKQGYGYQFLLQMPQESEDDVPCYELVKTSTFGPAACTA
ncbi:hypothetical protein LTR60_000379 [Cryomyces antarcticus]|nr:hypothetical protein LTR39_000594 [Cryomyces antarcticus]KAK5020592.1 hypothetical protein LTR60_000379 [Cryomyces antarcticus]